MSRATFFPDAEAFGKAVDVYLAECEAKADPPRRSGFCLRWGCNYDVIEDAYRRGPEWAVHYDRFHIACEDAMVKLLFSGKPVGAIFALKAKHGWQDTVKVDMTSRDAKMAVELNDSLWKGEDDEPKKDVPVQ